MGLMKRGFFSRQKSCTAIGRKCVHLELFSPIINLYTRNGCTLTYALELRLRLVSDHPMKHGIYTHLEYD